jgi:uncharacterized delta-60 repeat protein
METMGHLLTTITAQCCRFAALYRLGLVAGATTVSCAIAADAPFPEVRTVFATSIVSVSPEVTSAAALSTTELSESMEFMIALKMRNFAELSARLATGALVSPAELNSRYSPLQVDYQKVIDWLKAEGFSVVKTDTARLGVSARGTIAQIKTSLKTDFVRREAGGKIYPSATLAPSLPASVAAPVLSVNGLQPEIQLRRHSRRLNSGPRPQIFEQPPFFPREMLKAYNGDTLTADGAGQKIGIVIDTFPLDSDLTSFWSQTGVSNSLTNIEKVQVVSGSLAAPTGEETLDVEWASGIAPGAKVRVYASRDLSLVHLDQVFQQIITDLPSQPGLRQISISLGLGERFVSSGQLQTDAQFFASMAAAGVTVYVSSGDHGSNEGGQLQVSYYASDPSVTSVGGTSVSFNTPPYGFFIETAWSGSGGGVSINFNRPSWQAGTGVPAGTQRMVPDVAAAADPNTGALVVLNGDFQQIGGTSWSAPMWAGFSARLNQALIAAGQPTLGLLGPKVYPLIGTPSFRDITYGSNGAYGATVGYDLCTGIGVPQLVNLLTALTFKITAQPQDFQVTAGQPVAFNVAASSAFPLAYQWRRNGLTITGATSASYTLAAASRSDADYYDVVVTSGSYTLVSRQVRLSVAPTRYPAAMSFDPASALFLEVEADLTGLIAPFVSPVNQVLPLTAGKYLLAGDFSTANGRGRSRLAKFNSDDTLDLAFAPAAINGTVTTAAVQPDGKIVLGGNFSVVGDQARSGLARLNPDGSLDPTFTQSADAAVSAIVTQTDGKILLRGDFTSVGGQSRSHIARLNADGTLDSGFIGPSLQSATLYCFAPQSDGKVIIGGSLAAAIGRNGIARLNADGSLDASFNPNVNGAVLSMVLQTDGRIVIGGGFSSVGGATHNGIARLNTSGSVDLTFGSAIFGGVNALALQSDGKILVAGGFDKIFGVTRNQLARLTANGSLDTGFDPNPQPSYNGGGVITMAQVGDGGIFVAGVFSTIGGQPRNWYAKLNANGTASTAVAPVLRSIGSVYALAHAPGGKIYVGGWFTHVNGQPVGNGLVRINPDGSVDSSFSSSVSNESPVDINYTGKPTVFALCTQADGTLLVGGSFKIVSGYRYSFNLARLFTNGTMAHPGNAGLGLVNAIALQGDGKILLGAEGLVRMSYSFVSDFGVPTSSNVYSTGVSTIAWQPDGKIVIGGGFTTVAGQARNFLARIDANGSLDATFTPSARGFIAAIVPQPAGRLVVGGAFPSIAGQRGNIARFNADGSADASFNTGSGFDGAVTGLLAQEDGRVICVGSFSSFEGRPNTAKLARINPDGSADTAFTFAPGAARFSPMRAVLMTDSGDLWVGGTEEGGYSLARILALLPAVITTQPVSQTVAAGGTVTFAVVATGNPSPTYQWKFNGSSIAGATNATLTIANAQFANLGTYSVTVSNGLATVTSNAVTLSGSGGFGPTITTGFASRSVGLGGTTSFSVTATGSPPLSYAWRKNSVAITGATNSTFILSSINATDGGTYDVVVTNAVGSVGSAPGTLTVLPNPLAYNSQQFVSSTGVTAYFTVEGTQTKHLLLRVLGPALAGNVAGFLADPQFTLHDAQGLPLSSNDNWDIGLLSIFAQVGATPLPGGSADAAVHATLAPGAYKVRISGVSGATGIARLELFDTDTNSLSRVAYVGARGPAGSTGGVTSGLAITNSANKRLLVRAIGPTLGDTSALADPQLQIFDQASLFASNDNWGNASALVTAATQAGGFTLPTSSLDSAILVDARIGTGAYTAQVPSSSATGDVLLEIYDINSSGVPTYAPLVVVPPVGGTIIPGNSVTLRALAIGGGTLGYQWRKDGTNIAGATSSSLTFVAQASDGGSYDVTVTSGFGNATSAAATLSATHSADTNHDFRISLLELTRVIELYNTRNGTARTGCYRVDAAGEDGFASDASRLSGSSVTLTRYHSADTRGAGTGMPRDGAIDLIELTRVIELYNYRSGTTRTGQYHPQISPPTEDGFAPGP